MQALRLNFPGVSYVGMGAVQALADEARRLGTRAVLVTGTSGLRAAGVTDRLLDLLREGGVAATTFEAVPPEPDVGTVDAVRDLIRAFQADLVVEAGGGSALDAGKAAAALATTEAPTVGFHGDRAMPHRGLPHVAVATTAGTGAEVTRNAVLTDHDANLKKSIRSDAVMPTVSITDPGLTLSCPPGVTASAGMDALVQAIESFCSVHARPTTQALSLGAVRLVAEHLPAAWRDGQDRSARAAVSEGSYMAGLALGSARLGAVHGLAHPLGLLHEMPHGVVCAVLMPHVLRLNHDACPTAYDELTRAMGADPVERLRGLLDELELPRVLGQRPGDEWAERVLGYALASGSSLANPVQVDEAYVRQVLERVWSG